MQSEKGKPSVGEFNLYKSAEDLDPYQTGKLNMKEILNIKEILFKHERNN